MPSTCRVLLILVVLAAASCGAPALPTGPAVTPPSGGGGGKYQCKNVSGKTDPWLVEWDATQKARMQAAAHKGVLLVRYSGCDLEVLYGCEQAGTYDLVPTTLSTNTEYITNEDEVFAKLPVGAISLVGEFQQGDKWSLDYAILGMQQTAVNEVDGAQLKGECAQATHFVSATAIGAYRLVSEAKRKAAAGVEVFGAGAGASTGGAAGALRQAGLYDKCASGAMASDPDCQAVVQVFLEPVTGGTPEPVVVQKGFPKGEDKNSSSGEPAPKANAPSGTNEDLSNVEWIFSEPAGVQFTRTEITVNQYRTCANAGACSLTGVTMTFWDNEEQPKFAKYCNWNNKGRGNHPMNCIDWYHAQTVCAWLGGRLPTEDEWYAEASNGGDRDWPWGDSPEVNCDYAIWSTKKMGCGKDSTWPVCSKPLGNSVSGLCDMSGNLGEWTSTDYDLTHKVVRGGSWRNDLPELLSASFRSGGTAPAVRNSLAGVRCVRSGP